MENNEIILTPEGRDKLIQELEYREGELSAEIVERIKAARDFGDLSENSEYDDAKEEQAKNAFRINEIRTILANAKVSDASADKKSGNVPTVHIGSQVEVEDESGKALTFKIVGTTETNSLEHEISNESPMGAALIGAEEGSTVDYVTPSGKTRSFKVVKISF